MAVLDRGTLARAVAAAAGSTAGVAALVPGRGTPVVTHLPGGTVVGVGLGASAVSVHVVVDQLPLEPVTVRVAAAVTAVLSGAGDGRRADVVVEDVTDEAVTTFVRRRVDGGEVQ